MAEPTIHLGGKKPSVNAYGHGAYLSDNNVNKDKELERVNAQLAHAFNPTGRTLG